MPEKKARNHANGFLESLLNLSKAFPLLIIDNSGKTCIMSHMNA